MIKDEIIRLGRQLGQENEAAFNLWTWLPTHGIAKVFHGDYATEFTPSNEDVMKEACMVMSELCGYDHNRRERADWLETCPCDDPECPGVSWKYKEVPSG